MKKFSLLDRFCIVKSIINLWTFFKGIILKRFLFNEILNEFYKNKKYRFYFLFILSTFAGLFEYMGLILIFQFVLFLSNPNTKYCNEIIEFFKNNFNIADFSKITLILGVSISLIYILKNIYMFIFIRFSNNLLQDLSINITLKTIKNILFQDYLKIKEVPNDDKIAIFLKNELVIWHYCFKFINLISNCSIIVILVLFLFFKFALSATVALIFVSLLSFVGYKFLKMNSSYQNKYFSQAFNNFSSDIMKIINSTKEIKLSAQHEFFIEKIEKDAKIYTDLYKDKNYFSVFHMYFTEIIIMLAFILILGVLFYTTNFDNQLLITSISTICVIILRLAPVINRTQSCLYAMNSYRGVVLELLDFNYKYGKNISYILNKTVLPFEKCLEIKNVEFSYGDGDSGLKNINLKINKGEFVGIVGKSGCYKTTLSLIISGLIKPKKGEIFIDDNDLMEIDYQKWQNNIAFLSQDYSILFDGTDKVNQEILKKLGLDNIDLKIEEASFGEKHRIALANILTQEKEILILDEVSSSCDVISQEKINNILKELKGTKTIISIAHRLQILKYCDKIIYMDKGKIIDVDTLKALYDKYDEFKRIVELSSFEIN